MKMKTRPLGSAPTAHTIGRRGFAKISAIEGIALSQEAEADFREFDHRGLSIEERRKALLRKYGRKA